MSVSEAPILRFDSVTAPSGRRYDTGLWNASFSISSGELVLIRVESTQPNLPFADVAMGLYPHSRGEAAYLGTQWDSLRESDAQSARSTIGRFYEEGGWLSRLSVEENLTLAQRYNSRRPEREIREEAEKLCRAFGLPGVPRGLPHRVMAQDLARAACVRAFMGGPKLVILERPAQGVGLDMLPILINTVRAARQRGAGILWLTTERRIFDEAGMRPTRRFRMSGSLLLPVGDSA